MVTENDGVDNVNVEALLKTHLMIMLSEIITFSAIAGNEETD